MLTNRQIAWAATHDWFIGDNLDGTITVLDAYTLDGVLYENALHFTGTFSELRAFAGY